MLESLKCNFLRRKILISTAIKQQHKQSQHISLYIFISILKCFHCASKNILTSFSIFFFLSLSVAFWDYYENIEFYIYLSARSKGFAARRHHHRRRHEYLRKFHCLFGWWNRLLIYLCSASCTWFEIKMLTHRFVGNLL